MYSDSGDGTKLKAIAIGRWRFEPALWTSVAAALFVALTLALGQWQTRRAEDKLGLQARIEALAAEPAKQLPPQLIAAADFAQRSIEVRGEYIADKTLFIDNRVYRKQAGYHVLTPLRIGGGGVHVLINRGWIAAGSRREVLPQVATPAGEQVLQGLAVVPSENVYELAPDTAQGPVRQSLVLDRLRAQWSIALQPIVVLQTGGGTDKLVRDWPRPDAGANTHLAYALQWYVMAAVAALAWIALNLRRTHGNV